jgi:hypothetical protein
MPGPHDSNYHFGPEGAPPLILCPLRYAAGTLRPLQDR